MPPEKLLHTGLTVRGDSVYCPLAFSLDSYCIENGYDAIVIWEKEVRLKTNRIHLINKLNRFHKGDL